MSLGGSCVRLRTLRLGAQRIGAGDLDFRLAVKTGDEIELLAEEFNRMVEKLKASYDTLERQVQNRTRELSALYDVTATASQSLEVKPVLQEVIKKISDIFHLDATRIFLFDSRREELHLRAAFRIQLGWFSPANIPPGAGNGRQSGGNRGAYDLRGHPGRSRLSGVDAQ